MENDDAWVEEAAAWPVAFAQVREDAWLDLRVLGRLPPAARIVMVASGGCTAAALAASGRVGQLHLVDPNPAQLALARLKLHWLMTAPAAARKARLGHAPMPPAQREAEIAAGLAALGLPADALGPLPAVATLGPDHAGRYERLFAALRAAWRRHDAEVEALLSLSDPREQQRRTAPGTGLGRALDAAFDAAMALPHLVRLFGEAATQNRVEPFARHFARRTRHALAAGPAAGNPYLWQMLAGRHPAAVAAPWLDADAPTRPPALVWTHAPMDDALEASGGGFDLVHLSNILDWLAPAAARATLERAWAALRPGGMVFIRQLNSTLPIRDFGPRFEWLADEAAALHAEDRSFFYRALHLGRRR